ncbi:hypothetical protein FOA43_001483 [Brettanomyces nanus]|uniref:Myb-like domain-containing protein n=1 Tax=Eeniella nana TaxID=13502 RepID=A0A875S2W2_EENNA|nr:uncharacterized protein FOA43_001483 [Brettanomyces nanus]QPG74159.1 hypothetical protein FOA43_001483 [Brettanomyces nanus]
MYVYEPPQYDNRMYPIPAQTIPLQAQQVQPTQPIPASSYKTSVQQQPYLYPQQSGYNYPALPQIRAQQPQQLQPIQQIQNPQSRNNLAYGYDPIMSPTIGGTQPMAADASKRMYGQSPSLDLIQVRKGAVSTSTRRSSSAWPPEDDRLLRELKEEKNLGWREIASYFPHRTLNACQFRWRRLVVGIAKDVKKEIEERTTSEGKKRDVYNFSSNASKDVNSETSKSEEHIGKTSKSLTATKGETKSVTSTHNADTNCDGIDVALEKHSQSTKKRQLAMDEQHESQEAKRIKQIQQAEQKVHATESVPTGKARFDLARLLN